MGAKIKIRGQFWAFVRKEFYHILRDKRTVLILLGMPIVQIILFGFAISTEVRNVRVAVLDQSRDVATRQITERFAANPYFTVAQELTSQGQIEQTLRADKADMVIVFSERFDENFRHTGQAAVQLIVNGTDPNSANTMVGYATNIINGYIQSQAQGLKPPLQVTPNVKLLYNPQMKGAYNFVPGVMGLILMLICAMMTSISIVREKERGTMEILLVSPMKPLLIIIAKVVPYLVLSAVNLTTILLLSFFVLDVPVAGSLLLLAGISLIFIIVALSLGILISTLVTTQVAAMLASGMVLMMPVVILSGMVFPVENMPSILQWISNIIPARWFIIAIKKVMIEGLGIQFVVKEIAILVSMAVVLIAVSLRNFKPRLE